MKKLLIVIAVLLSGTAMLFADENKVYNLEITYLLRKDGSARVEEIWEIDAREGTEWYLVRNNLGDIKISEFSVSDERNIPYTYDEPWEIKRSMEEKAVTCGINYTDKGLELCWGLSSYGHHTYTVRYTMSNVVKSLRDYDMLHIQTISRGLSSAPQKAKTTIVAEGMTLNSDNSRIWGFGYTGSANYVDGKAVFESSEPFVGRSSMISLMRFDKGWFNSSSSMNITFDEQYSMAMQGADFEGEEEENPLLFIAIFIGSIVLVVLGTKWLVKATRKGILGIDYEDVEWSREIPFDGNIVISDSVLTLLMENRKSSSIASALILRMIYQGALKVFKDKNGKLEIAFNDEFHGSLDKISQMLYDMMKEASGEDKILQEKEFSRWSKRNNNKITKWILETGKETKRYIKENHYKVSSEYTPEFQTEARKLLGLKRFLIDFTEMKTKDTLEVQLWKEYLVFASLFEIADLVARQLEDIDPKTFEETMPFDYPTFHYLLVRNASLAKSITNTVASAGTGSAGGFGGSSSFGGGRGFSGGGFGGGAR